MNVILNGKPVTLAQGKLTISYDDIAGLVGHVDNSILTITVRSVGDVGKTLFPGGGAVAISPGMVINAVVT